MAKKRYKITAEAGWLYPSTETVTVFADDKYEAGRKAIEILSKKYNKIFITIRKVELLHIKIK